MTVRTPEPAAVLAKAGRENFPVASALFPRDLPPLIRRTGPRA